MTHTNPLQHLFPKGQLTYKKIDSLPGLYLPIGEQTWLFLEWKDLTERERQLAQLLLNENQNLQDNPWFLYFQENAPLPQSLRKLQVIQVRIWSFLDTDSRQAWLDMMTALLPNLQSSYTTNNQDYYFILEQAPFFDVKEILRDTLATMEFDFGLRLTIFLGQAWPQKLVQTWPDLIQTEQELFHRFLAEHQQSRLLTFSQLYLWTGQDYPILRKGLASLIAHQQLEKVILALWQEGGVLTKAAQSLYIHRNTLQYRLDKWFDWTGLQLKDLTDLALCYIVMIGRGETL